MPIESPWVYKRLAGEVQILCKIVSETLENMDTHYPNFESVPRTIDQLSTDENGD